MNTKKTRLEECSTGAAAWKSGAVRRQIQNRMPYGVRQADEPV